MESMIHLRISRISMMVFCMHTTKAPTSPGEVENMAAPLLLSIFRTICRSRKSGIFHRHFSLFGRGKHFNFVDPNKTANSPTTIDIFSVGAMTYFSQEGTVKLCFRSCETLSPVRAPRPRWASMSQSRSPFFFQNFRRFVLDCLHICSARDPNDAVI